MGPRGFGPGEPGAHTWRAGMTDLILASNDNAIGQLCAKVDPLLCANGWQHEGPLWNACHTAEKKNCSLERCKEEPRASKEEVAWNLQQKQ